MEKTIAARKVGAYLARALLAALVILGAQMLGAEMIGYFLAGGIMVHRPSASRVMLPRDQSLPRCKTCGCSAYETVSLREKGNCWECDMRAMGIPPSHRKEPQP